MNKNLQRILGFLFVACMIGALDYFIQDFALLSKLYTYSPRQQNEIVVEFVVSTASVIVAGLLAYKLLLGTAFANLDDSDDGP